MGVAVAEVWLSFFEQPMTEKTIMSTIKYFIIIFAKICARQNLETKKRGRLSPSRFEVFPGDQAGACSFSRFKSSTSVPAPFSLRLLRRDQIFPALYGQNPSVSRAGLFAHCSSFVQPATARVAASLQRASGELFGDLNRGKNIQPPAGIRRRHDEIISRLGIVTDVSKPYLAGLWRIFQLNILASSARRAAGPTTSFNSFSRASACNGKGIVRRLTICLNKMRTTSPGVVPISSATLEACAINLRSMRTRNVSVMRQLCHN